MVKVFFFVCFVLFCCFFFVFFLELFECLFLKQPEPLGGSVAVSVAGWSAGKGGRLVG